MKKPLKKQTTLSLKTAIPVPPWRKAELTYRAQTIVRVDGCTRLFVFGFKAERVHES